MCRSHCYGRRHGYLISLELLVITTNQSSGEGKGEKIPIKIALREEAKPGLPYVGRPSSRLAGANNRNVIITYRFLAGPVQANRDFSILTV